MNPEHSSAVSVFRHAAHEGKKRTRSPNHRETEVCSLLVDCKLTHRVKRDDFQSTLVRGLKNDAWSHVVLVSLLPARGTETPAVSGFETGETVFRHRGGKVVASEFGELKELSCQFHTNGVRTMILIIGVATTIAKESRQRIGATRLERTAQNIQRFVGVYSCNHLMSSRWVTRLWRPARKSLVFFMPFGSTNGLNGAS